MDKVDLDAMGRTARIPSVFAGDMCVRRRAGKI